MAKESPAKAPRQRIRRKSGAAGHISVPMEVRVAACLKDLRKGLTSEEIQEKYAKKYGCGEREVRDWIRKALDIMAKHLDDGAATAKAESIAAYTHLYTVARKSGNLKAAIRAREMIDRVRGNLLDRPPAAGESQENPFHLRARITAELGAGREGK